jgi:hypothetical protein
MMYGSDEMGKKIPCKICGRLLGIRDVICVILPVLEDPVKTVTLHCSKCNVDTDVSYNM